MRHRLKNGKIEIPSSASAARNRIGHIKYELAKIEVQLVSTTRVDMYPTIVDYNKWKTSARCAFKWLSEEKRQLEEWLSGHPEEDLLRNAWEVLKNIHEDLDGEFDDQEQKTLDKLNEHFMANTLENTKLD